MSFKTPKNLQKKLHKQDQLNSNEEWFLKTFVLNSKFLKQVDRCKTMGGALSTIFSDIYLTDRKEVEPAKL